MPNWLGPSAYMNQPRRLGYGGSRGLLPPYQPPVVWPGGGLQPPYLPPPPGAPGGPPGGTPWPPMPIPPPGRDRGAPSLPGYAPGFPTRGGQISPTLPGLPLILCYAKLPWLLLGGNNGGYLAKCGGEVRPRSCT